MHIFAVGKKHDTWIQEAVARYEKRLRPPFDVSWQFIPYSSKSDYAARKEESGAILQRLKPDDFVILLDEIGKNYSSPELSQLIDKTQARARRIVFVIGGAYGVSKDLQLRANVVWSLSRLVFPHMLVRAILIEQLYRAQEICHSRPYHHM